jgi:CMP-N,N'-diacetyllegionaminic acid synthase
MIDGFSVLGVVPARGGSKGIKLKNLREVGGKSLVVLAAEVALAVREIDYTVVSTDHEAIAAAAEAAGIAAPFRRPETLSGDRIGDLEVLVHALEASEAIRGQHFDIVVMLQPTSPLRRPEDVKGALRMLVDGGYDSVWSVSETDSKAHPLKQLTIDNGRLDYYDPAGAQIIARQQLQPVFHRNGIVYAIRRQCLIEQKTIKGRNTGAYVVTGNHISIDTEWDLELVDYLIARGKPQAE